MELGLEVRKYETRIRSKEKYGTRIISKEISD